MGGLKSKFLFPFLLQLGTHLGIPSGTRKKFPWRRALQLRLCSVLQKGPPGAHEGCSSCTMRCKKKAECPIENIGCKNPVKQEYIIPAWILHICISSACPGYDQPCILLYRSTSHMHLKQKAIRFIYMCLIVPCPRIHQLHGKVIIKQLSTKKLTPFSNYFLQPRLSLYTISKAIDIEVLSFDIISILQLP